MTRLMLFLAALNGSRAFTRLALFYVVGMVFLFYCLIGGMPLVHRSPARPLVNASNSMPEQKPLPPGLAAEEMRKRTSNRHYGPH